MLHDDHNELVSHKSEPETTSVDVSAETLEAVKQLYDDALYLQAYHRAMQAGPMDRWKGAEAQVLAGRLILNIGNHRLGRILHQRAYRQNPHDVETSYYYIYSRMERQGPLEAWQMMQQMGDWPDAAPDLRADWFSLQAQIASFFRDHQSVDKLLKQAEDVAPIRPWLCVVQSGVLQNADRYSEALEWVDRGLSMKPWHRACVLQRASLLRLTEREEEAEAFLLEASRHIESATIFALLSRMHSDKAQFDASFNRTTREYLDKYVELSPMLDREEKKWVDAARADLAYLEGDYQQFQHYTTLSKNKYLERLVPRLTENPTGKRVLLDVPYVRQHRSTCAPATLTALAKFWKRTDVEHLRLAAIICYDGTPDHAERHWAESNGWIAREFTVTWESTIALIDRGIPFTLTTIEPGAGHLQAVAGYDARRGTIILRDPSSPHVGEMDQVEGLKRYAAFGPRGMVLLPQEEAGRLDGLVLPDEARYDQVFRLQRALEKHDRPVAQQHFEALLQQGAEHRLAHWARRLLANYDDDQVASFAANDALLKLSPDNTTLRLSHLSSMIGLARRSERLEKLREYSNASDADPIFGQMLASELSNDARQQDLARRLLRRAIRTRPMTASSYITLADLQWGLMNRTEALELYRIAACLDDKVESYARSYFNAAVCMGQTETAVQWLRDRERQTLTQSSQPAKTLHWAFDKLNRSDDAFKTLEEALAARPDDAELKLYVADYWLQCGEVEKALGLLEQAKEKAARTRWLRSQSFLEDCRGDLPAALQCWEAILEIEPLSSDAHRTATRLRAEINGKDAARAELKKLTERYPHHYGLQSLYIEWLQDDAIQLEQAVAQFLERFPDDSWAHREQAKVLCDQNRLEPALAAAEQAVRLDPCNPASLAFRARIKLRQGKLDEANQDYLNSLKLDIDYSASMQQYVELGSNRADKQQRLRQLFEELQKQSTQGEGISTYQAVATDYLPAEELLRELRAIWTKRQDLWMAWSCYASQLLEKAAQIDHGDVTHQGHLDEARKIAQQATERFPLLPAAWGDLAKVHRFRKHDADEIEALQQARKLNPNWGQANRSLADAYERQGKLQEAEACLKDAIARGTLDPINHVWLADFFSKHDRKEEAVASYRTAILHSPGYEFAWDALRQLAIDLKQDDLAVNVARELTERRPREARSWLFLADALVKPEQLDQKLQALEKAKELNPRFSDIYDKQAEALAEAGRFEEALAACQPPVETGSPRHLQGRFAWILWQQGKKTEAIAKMQALVAEDEGYFWAVHQLVQWFRTMDREADQYAYYARHLIRISPKFAAGHIHLAEALLKLEDRDGAKTAYRRALQLDPSHDYAGISLFDEHFTDQEWDQAAEALAILDTQGENPFVDTRALQLACTRKTAHSMTEVKKRLRRVALTSPSDNHWPIETSIAAVWEVEPWRELLKNTLIDVLKEDKVQPFTANMLTRVIATDEGYKLGEEVVTQIDQRNPELGKQCYQGFFFYLSRQPYTLTHQFIQQHAERLRSDIDLWGLAGATYSLDEKAGYPDAKQWLGDYATRSDGKPWMLLNYVMPAIAGGNWRDASEASKHALTWGTDNQSHCHMVWLSLHALLAGHLEEAEGFLKDIDRENLDPLHGYLADAVTASLETLNEKITWKQYVQKLADAAAQHQPVPQDRPALRAARRKLFRYVADTRFGWWGWFKAQRLYTSETMPPIGKVATQATGTSSSGGNWSWSWLIILVIYAVFRLISCSSPQQTSMPTMMSPQLKRILQPTITFPNKVYQEPGKQWK